MNYCCYYSEISKEGKKLDLKHLNRIDDTYKIIEASNVKEAIDKFNQLNPNLRMIGIRRDREFSSVPQFSSGLIGKLYK